MLTLTVTSPVKKITELKCKKITVPTQSGLITILPKHASLYSILSSGEVVAEDESGRDHNIIVSGGFVSVSNDDVSLLVDFGIHSDDLDEKIILEAKERAEKMIEEHKEDNLTKVAQADLLHANLQLQFLSRKIKKH